MPLTPLHLAAAAPAKAALGPRFSVGLFFAVQCAIDVEPLARMAAGHDQLHGLLHSFSGSLFVAAFVATGWQLLAGSRFWRFTVPRLSWPVALGTAWWAAWSHVWLDSMMHVEMRVQRFLLSIPAPSEQLLNDTLLGLLIIAAPIAAVRYAGVLSAGGRRALARLGRSG